MPGLLANTYIWSPPRSSQGCTVADSTGNCLQCQSGAAASGGVCLIRADQLHLTFENSVLDLSGQERHAFIVGASSGLAWAAALFAPEGNYAISPNGAITAVQLPTFVMGGV